MTTYFNHHHDHVDKATVTSENTACGAVPFHK